MGYLSGKSVAADEKWVARQMSHGKGRLEGNGQALRVGALTVLNIGTPRIDLSAFHTSAHIFPHLYCSTRIFWSMKRAGERTLYVFEVLTEADFEGSDIDLQDYTNMYVDRGVHASDGYAYPLPNRGGDICKKMVLGSLHSVCVFCSVRF